MKEKIFELYEKFKHLDFCIGDKEWCGKDVGYNIAREMWLEIKKLRDEVLDIGGRWEKQIEYEEKLKEKQNERKTKSRIVKSDKKTYKFSVPTRFWEKAINEFSK